MAKKKGSDSIGQAEKKSVIALEQKLPEVPNRDAYLPPAQHLVKDGKGGVTP
ncbi:MAG: hypothetical protein NG747_11020 [Candidatus Brocadia sp.]|nr:hypothetical protein [Candidatus Brocadia sp.]